MNFPHTFRRSALPVVLLGLLLSLAVSGCQRMGMANIKPAKLEEKYGGPTSQFITVDGVRFHYRIDGNPNGPGVVLLHGVLASTHTWDGWVENIGSKYHMLRMDLPGFGLSEPLKDKTKYTPEYAVEIFEKVRVAIGAEHPEFKEKFEKFNLVGNSLGGFISWYYATKFPERIIKLILIDPIAYQQPLPRIIKFASGGFGGLMAQISSPRFIVRKNVRKVYGNPESPTDETILRYHELLLYKGHKTAMVEYFKTLRKYNEEDTMAKFVPQIKVPTLLMFGGKDRWVPPALIDQWKRDVEGLQVKVYDEGGHIPMEEFPLETSRDADEFMGGGASEAVASSGAEEEAAEPAAEAEEAEEPVAAPAAKKSATKPAKTAQGVPAWE
jgi:pimeloyl-ACP methyl ester carboxylesterase